MYGQGAVICPVTPVYHVQPSETVVTKVRQHVYSIASIIFDQKSFLKKTRLTWEKTSKKVASL